MARTRVAGAGEGDAKAKKGELSTSLLRSTRFSIFSGAKKAGVEKKKRGTLSDHAGILFPAQRILRKSFLVDRPPLFSLHLSGQMKNSNVASRVYKEAAVFLAGSIDYVASEILMLASDTASENKRVRITPRYLTLAVRSDDEFEK